MDNPLLEREPYTLDAAIGNPSSIALFKHSLRTLSYKSVLKPVQDGTAQLGRRQTPIKHQGVLRVAGRFQRIELTRQQVRGHEVTGSGLQSRYKLIARYFLEHLPAGPR